MKKLCAILAVLLCLCGCAGTAGPSPEANRSEAAYSDSVSAVSSDVIQWTLDDLDVLEAGSIVTDEQVEAIGADALFSVKPIDDAVFARMDGVSFGESCTTAREDLRYLRILHTGFDGETHVGELVVNEALADDLLAIFRALYDTQYPIESVRLVDDFGGDDEASMEANNTSCFNFREVSGTAHLSQHAYGRAIDINPLYNPYITSRGFEPVNAGDYVERIDGAPHQINESDLCYRLFTEHGFTWGGSWNSVKDYQHFERPE